jgi:hypothetical protein
MKYSPTIEIVLQLAAREAIAGRHPEIEPEHLLIALLKFAETDLKAMLQAGGAPILTPMLDEQQTLRSVLDERIVDSKLFRRQLRSALGTGKRPPDATAIHRSRAAKRAFAAAAFLVDHPDFHPATDPGLLPPAAVVARATARGVDVLALTDHDEVSGLAEARAAAADAGAEAATAAVAA